MDDRKNDGAATTTKPVQAIELPHPRQEPTLALLTILLTFRKLTAHKLGGLPR